MYFSRKPDTGGQENICARHRDGELHACSQFIVRPLAGADNWPGLKSTQEMRNMLKHASHAGAR